MYPACMRGAWTAGPEGVRGRAPRSSMRARSAMTSTECPDPVSDRFAVTPKLPFRSLDPLRGPQTQASVVEGFQRAQTDPSATGSTRRDRQHVACRGGSSAQADAKRWRVRAGTVTPCKSPQLPSTSQIVSGLGECREAAVANRKAEDAVINSAWNSRS